MKSANEFGSRKERGTPTTSEEEPRVYAFQRENKLKDVINVDTNANTNTHRIIYYANAKATHGSFADRT